MMGELSLKPLYLTSVWAKPGATARRASLAVLLPSGVGAGDFTVRVVDDGEFAEFTALWPAALMTLEVLHKKWLGKRGGEGFEEHHTKRVGLENALNKLRSWSSHAVEPAARIPLPFPVQTHIVEKHNLAWKDSTSKIAYLDLKAFEDEYAVAHDAGSFQAVWL